MGVGTIAVDSSGNNNDGMIANAQWVLGICGGQALSFNGIDAYVEVPYSPELGLTNALRIEACVQRFSQELQVNSLR